MKITKKIFQWTVVGAGPAGIAAIGKLLDAGIDGSDILWIDPLFGVGDLGQLWRNVSSNTNVKRFIDFLKASAAFSFDSTDSRFVLNRLDPENTCVLSDVSEPLQWVSNQLTARVNCEITSVHTMHLSQRLWYLKSETRTFRSRNVILATGAVPSSLDYPGVDVIPFEVAIDKERLAPIIETDSSYAVFGSSHSAIIILRHLVELGVKKIINFYRSPCRYAIDMGTWILFDNTGLKGQAAAWAKEHIDGTLPKNLVRYSLSKRKTAHYLSECHHIVYAVGFERRNNIIIEDFEFLSYNPHVGIIGPGLFGLGIAWPERKADPYGNIESQVGLWKFMVYLNNVLPLWFKYQT